MSDDGGKRRERRIRRIVTAGTWLVRLLGWTWRFRVRDDGEVRALRTNRTPIVFALWHGQLLPLLYFHRNQNVCVLISEHDDGEIIARIAERLGYRTLRGSTSRGAARALLGLVRELQGGHDLAITPDGPRGPARSVAPGTLIVAQRSGAPVIAVAVAVKSGWHLKSWDRFLIPRPFTRIGVGYAPAFRVDAADARDAATNTSRVAEALATAAEAARG